MPGYLAALCVSAAHLGEASSEVGRSYLEELRQFPDLFNILVRTGLAEAFVQD